MNMNTRLQVRLLLRCRVSAHLPSDIRIHQCWLDRTSSRIAPTKTLPHTAAEADTQKAIHPRHSVAAAEGMVAAAEGMPGTDECATTSGAHRSIGEQATVSPDQRAERADPVRSGVGLARERMRFDVRHTCTSRVYEYLVPMWALDPKVRVGGYV